MYDAIALGELLIDFASVASDAEGYPTMAAHPGGAPANFLAAINKFGGRTALLGKVGNDSFGHLLLKTLQNSGIDTVGMKLSDEHFTTLAFVSFDEHGERSFSFSRKPGADTQLSFDEIDLNIIDKARMFHFGTLSLSHEPSRTATVKAVEYAKSRGKLISFDPNLRKPLWDSMEKAKAAMEWGLKQTEIVKISDDEVDFLWQLSPEAGADKLISDYGVKLAFVTCGAEGCVYKNAYCEGRVAAMQGLNVIDTCGAGDIFGGSAAWKILQSGKEPENLGKSELEEIVRFACTAAGLSTERSGGISSIPDLDEIMAVL